MVLLIKKMYRLYDVVFNELSDPRALQWPLMGSPFPTIFLLAFYLYFVNSLGPRLMKDRQPIKLKTVMIIYNAIQVIACAYLVYRGYVLAWNGTYRLLCEPINYSYDENSMAIVGATHFYYKLKLSDLLDTVFFVLRKKNSHVTFLHVYHHTGMVVLAWAGTKFLPGGHGTSLGVINSFVHVIMYSYYLLTLIDDKYKKSLWWKKHITQLQLLQFFLLVIHFSTLLFVPNCAYPVWTAFVLVPQNFFMMVLFGDFYIRTYIRKPTKKTDLEQKTIQSDADDINKLNNSNGKTHETIEKIKVT